MRARLVVAALALALLPLQTRADMTFTGTAGGPGGGEYDIRCGAASYVSGITTFSGSWLDGLSVHCGILNRNNLPNRFFEREVAPYNAPEHAGGWHPNQHTLTCGPDYAVIGLEVYDVRDPAGTFVGIIKLYCQRMNPPYDRVSSNPSPATMPPGAAFRWTKVGDLYCPARQWAVGVYGKSGVYVDSIGLVCDVEYGDVVPQDAASTVVFSAPTINGYPVDVCLWWGKECGQPAADAFCRAQGLGRATAHAGQGNAPPTYVQGDGAVCQESYCARFTSITCAR